MDPLLQSIVDYVMEYASSSTNWLSIKKEIMWRLPISKRKDFSRRHYSTKKHTVNKLEEQIIEYWRLQTGVTLSIPQEKLHDLTWTRHRPGWGLRKYNRIRQLAAAKRKKYERKSSKKTS